MKTVLSIFLQASSILLLSTFLLLSPFGTITSDATNYLSVKESTGITLGSGGIAVIGNITKNNRTKDGLSNWIKPLPGEKKIMSFLGGKYYPGKTNFLDNGFGSVATSFAAVPILIGLNAKWPRDEKEKDISQDLFLLSTGLLATNGITELFKGVFRRQRPLVSLYPQNISKEDKSKIAFNAQSFISGHSSLAFYTVTYLNLRLRTAMRQNLSADEYHDWSWLSPTILYGWATFVGWSRIHVYKHYPSDVIAGALIGSLLGELFYSLNDKISSNRDIYVSKTTFFKISFSF